MYKGVECIMNISPLLIPSLDHSEVFEMEGEFLVKGRKRDVYFYFFPLLHSLAFLSVQYLNDWIPPPYRLLFVDHVCIFTVCFWSGCSVLAGVRGWCVSKGRRGLARGWCGWGPGPVLGWRG